VNALSISPGELTREQVLDALSTILDEVIDAHATGDELPVLDDTFVLARAAHGRGDPIELDQRLGELSTGVAFARARLRADHPEVCS
jgi:hypothetical protein